MPRRRRIRPASSAGPQRLPAGDRDPALGEVPARRGCAQVPPCFARVGTNTRSVLGRRHDSAPTMVVSASLRDIGTATRGLAAPTMPEKAGPGEGGARPLRARSRRRRRGRPRAASADPSRSCRAGTLHACDHVRRGEHWPAERATAPPARRRWGEGRRSDRSARRSTARNRRVAACGAGIHASGCSVLDDGATCQASARSQRAPAECWAGQGHDHADEARSVATSRPATALPTPAATAPRRPLGQAHARPGRVQLSRHIDRSARSPRSHRRRVPSGLRPPQRRRMVAMVMKAEAGSRSPSHITCPRARARQRQAGVRGCRALAEQVGGTPPGRTRGAVAMKLSACSSSIGLALGSAAGSRAPRG